MSFTSVGFFLFVVFLAVFYYFPGLKKYQWMILLVGSAFFYCYAAFRYVIYLLFSIVSAYLSTIAMKRVAVRRGENYSANKENWQKSERKKYKRNTDMIRKCICAVTLVLNFGLLAAFKLYGSDDFSLSSLLGLRTFSRSTLNVILPLGISFYTFQIMGYVIDVYRENIEPERSIAKLALFSSFFPQIVQGPIGTWSDLSDDLFKGHSFCYEEFRDGLELILWGLLKKMVIADRAASVIGAVASDWTATDGAVLGMAVLLYNLQLYADFSGGIDIARGVASLYGINLSENFKRPYFASSVSEFWRRWHITLGAWMKKYLFYPLALSEHSLLFVNRNKERAKSGFGKHVVTVLPSCAATFAVFIVVGIWHGTGTQYLAFGIYNGLLISLSMLLEPVFAVQNKKLGIPEDSRLLKAFRIVRTFVIVSVGNITDLAKSFTESVEWFIKILVENHVSVILTQKRSIPITGSDFVILLIGALVIFMVSFFQERNDGESVRGRINKLRLPLRWAVLLTGVLVVLVFGIYGPGYDSASFIYMQF